MAESHTANKPAGHKRAVNEILIGHADRLWNSECENAARIAGRLQLLGGAALVLAGLSTFGSEWFYYIPSAPICPKWATIAIHVLFGLSIILLGCTLAILYARKGTKPTANSVMEIDKEDVTRSIKYLVFVKTYRAYLTLKERNLAEKKRLNKGERFFAWAVALTFIAILVYIFASLGAKINPQK